MLFENREELFQKRFSRSVYWWGLWMGCYSAAWNDTCYGWVPLRWRYFGFRIFKPHESTHSKSIYIPYIILYPLYYIILYPLYYIILYPSYYIILYPLYYIILYYFISLILFYIPYIILYPLYYFISLILFYIPYFILYPLYYFILHPILFYILYYFLWIVPKTLPAAYNQRCIYLTGFFHEQSRDDRNKHVKIIWGNIPVGKLLQPLIIITIMITIMMIMMWWRWWWW